MPKAKKAMTKKQLKKLINDNGLFRSMKLSIEKNVPAELAKKVPEGATFFEGIASTGDKNRNGYIIRAEAWKAAVNEFMQNPIILLQHDAGNPIGQCLNAEVVGNELRVQGYIYDDMTAGAFGRNLLKALSTGHITEEVEFENEETGEVISEEEYLARREKGEIGWADSPWVLAVTKLQWCEFSLVAVGSNRKSFVTKTNAIEAFLKNGKLTEAGMREIAKNGGSDDEEEEGDEREEKHEVDAEDFKKAKDQLEKDDGEEESEEGEEEKASESEESEEGESEETDSGESSDEDSQASEKKDEKSETPDDPEEGGEGGDEGEPEEEEGAEGSEEGGEEADDNASKKIAISAEDRKALENSAETLRKVLEETFVKKNDDEGDDKDDGAGEAPADGGGESEEEGKEKTGEENAAGDITKAEFESLPQKAQTLFKTLATLLVETNAKVENLETELTEVKKTKVNKRVLISQFGGVADSEEKDAKKSDNKNDKEPAVKKGTGEGLNALFASVGIKKS